MKALAAFALIALPFCLLSQNESGHDSYTLAGAVVNSATGEPVKRALVWISGFPSHISESERGARNQVFKQALSDDAGNFRFSDLESGAYTINVMKPEFQAQALEHTVSITVGPSREDIELKLSPLASIEGTVLNGDGSPLEGVLIQVVRPRITEGRREIQISSSATTDDRGHYRIWNLPPGNTYLKAAGRAGGTRLYLGERAPSFNSREAFAPVYYGGATSFAEAQPVALKAGSRERADFALSLQPAFKIRGSLANFTSYQNARFELLSAEERISSARVSFNPNTGKFEIQDVVPGTYRVRATQREGDKNKRGESAVTLTDSDVKDIVLQLLPGVDLSGAVYCGPAAKSSTDSDEQADAGAGSSSFCGATVQLISVDGQDKYKNEGPPARSITLRGVLPGDYWIEVNTYGGYVSSLTAGGIDLLSSHKLTVQPGSNPGPIEIRTREDGGTIEGALDLETRPAGASILLAPDFASAAGPTVTQVEPNGQFVFGQIAPGDYTLYALTAIADFEYANPESIQTLKEGKKIRVEPNGGEQIKLTSFSK